LAPQKSIIQELYKPQAHSFVRVVYGAPVSWDPNTTATTYTSSIDRAVWSPCGGFIAIGLDGTNIVDVLDSVTFQWLQTFELPQNMVTHNGVLIFSPDSHVLTCINGGTFGLEQFVTSWDLQTGGIVSVIKWQGPKQIPQGKPSIAYSANGKMVGIVYWYHGHTSICVCDVISGTQMHSHLFRGTTLPLDVIWTHEESFRFATASGATITIWEILFVSSSPPTVVETLHAPGMLPLYFIVGSTQHMRPVQLLPAPCRLAIVSHCQVLVWDIQNSKYLLDCIGPSFHPAMSFSSNGHFFACSTTGSDVYLWKESPTDYGLHNVLTPKIMCPTPLLSPNGESIAILHFHTIQLWHTNQSTTSPSRISTPQLRNFLLDFSLDGTFAIVTMRKNDMVTVLNLKSGVLQWSINTGMKIWGIRVVGNTIVVIGDWKVAAWDLPVGGCVPNVGVGLEDSSWTTNLSSSCLDSVIGASISPDFHCVAIITKGGPTFELYTFNASTGKQLDHCQTMGRIPWFAPDGCDVWCIARDGGANVWRAGGEQNLLDHLEQKVDIEHLPEGYPWRSSYGYQVTDDWWILGPDGKRLLMLPPAWQSYAVRRVWKGQFLALLHEGLSEPVILEMEL
jgi:WD40 repeat protein